MISFGVQSALVGEVVDGAGGFQPAGLYPAGGTLNMRPAPQTPTSMIAPTVKKAVWMPEERTTLEISGPKISVPAPNPNTARPVIVPRMSGNHLMQVAIGVTYANPTPNPPRMPYAKTIPPTVWP